MPAEKEWQNIGDGKLSGETSVCIPSTVIGPGYNMAVM